MLRLRATTTVPKVDMRSILAIVPFLREQWRDVRFEQDVYVDPDGCRREGLQVLHGAHPLPGTTYLVSVPPLVGPVADLPMMTAAGADGAMSVAVELLAFDDRSLRLRGSQAAADWTVDVELLGVDPVTRVNGELVATLPYRWPLGGRLRAKVVTAVDQVLRADSTDPQVVAELQHPVARGDVQLRIGLAADGLWTVDIAVRCRGRGLARPVLAVLAIPARRAARRRFDAIVGTLPGAVDRLNVEIELAIREDPDPQRAAEELLEALLFAVPETVA